MPRWVFILFEVCFMSFWAVALFTRLLPNQQLVSSIFLGLMLINGFQHLIWFAVKRRYNPGLVTAVLHVLWFGYWGAGLLLGNV